MTNTDTDCCGGTGIGCACGIQPVVQLCQRGEVPAMSRAFGIPVSGDTPDGRHHPSCGGCQGKADSDTCPYSVRLREYAAGFRPSDDGPSAVALNGCDDCSVEPGETHRYAGCPGNRRAAQQAASEGSRRGE